MGKYVVEEYVNQWVGYVKQGEFDDFEEAYELFEMLERGRIREFKKTYWKTIAKK